MEKKQYLFGHWGTSRKVSEIEDFDLDAAIKQFAELNDLRDPFYEWEDGDPVIKVTFTNKAAEEIVYFVIVPI